MKIEIKYRHPLDHSLDWSGRGKAPKWYDYALGNGFTEEALLVETQLAHGVTDSEYDLGIGEVTRLSTQPVAIVSDVRLELAETAPSSAVALAREFGYDGPLTQGYIEDEIRAYQRRTVETCLELGRRLLLLRELSQIGTEFDGRLKLLGFSRATAYRFMQAAAKSSKSANLTVLSTQVKSVSAFLELITHDDDELKEIAEMDDIDRLSASQLRERLRNSEQSINRLQTDLNTASSRLSAEAKTLPPPLLSREVDKQIQAALNAEAMGAAALDLLNRQVGEMAGGGDYLAERAATLHSCLSAMASRVSMAFSALQAVADDCEISLPPRPQMVVSEEMARDYLAAHTGYIEIAIELAQKALIARGDVIGRGRGRLPGSKNKQKTGEA